MSDLDRRTNKINSGCPSNEIGIFPTSGDKIVLDKEAPEIFKFLRVETAGTIVFVSTSNQTIVIPDAQPGEDILALGQKVLSSGTTAQGFSASTTATGIFWFGGK